MWYKKQIKASARNSVWNPHIRYGWFSIAIEWDSPQAVEDFQKNEDIRDSIEDNCLLATSQLERAGFPKQHSFLLFTDEYIHNDATDSEAGAEAVSHMIKIPVTEIYNDDWSEILVHEWAHKFFWNLSKSAKDYFREQYNRLIKGSIENDVSPELLQMIEEVVPEVIKEKFPEDMDMWKIYVSNTLHKPEMEGIREYLKRKGFAPTSYASVNMEELWSECVSNYSKLSREIRKIISEVVGS